MDKKKLLLSRLLFFAYLAAVLFLCFFHVPVAASVRGDGIALKSPKDVEALEDALRGRP